jgi:hypothetical protein
MPPFQISPQERPIEFLDSRESSEITPPTLTYCPDERCLDYLCLSKLTGILLPFHFDNLHETSDQNDAPKLRVSFSEKLELQFSCIGREDYSREELQNNWYTLQELREMKEEKNRTIQRMELGQRREKNSTYRGLEIQTSAGGIYRNKLKKKHLETIMKVQEKQMNLDSSDWDELANASKEISEQSRRLALQFAMKDQKDAIKIHSRE